MARGANKRDGRVARSELPSGVEATEKDISRLVGQITIRKMAEEYAANFEKKAEYKSFGKVNIGDGVVGNGIIENGQLVLRDEDIDKIIEENFGKDTKTIESLIGDGGGEQPFALFAGDNNKVDKNSSPEALDYWNKSSTALNHEIGVSPVELPSGDDFEVEDFSPRERRTWDDPGADASGSLTIGRADVPSHLLQVAYEKIAGMPVNRDSIIELAIALDNKINKAARIYEENKSESFDWDEYGRGDDRDYEEDYD
jgi:hypothetical protein